MRQQEQRYPSGLVAVEWAGECEKCGAGVTVCHPALARGWERTHARFGCDRPLHMAETGRGWEPAPPVLY
ncbi:hypothetical protein [Pseudonocardia sp.]|jgi:hypothetical protein|uniref:hypothetical protein n=1 Tax=Pseudonocardia sp. TaxID=60912 RepID=UPI0031FE122C